MYLKCMLQSIYEEKLIDRDIYYKALTEIER